MIKSPDLGLHDFQSQSGEPRNDSNSNSNSSNNKENRRRKKKQEETNRKHVKGNIRT